MSGIRVWTDESFRSWYEIPDPYSDAIRALREAHETREEDDSDE